MPPSYVWFMQSDYYLGSAAETGNTEMVLSHGATWPEKSFMVNS